jgi:hypothetical protein
MLGVQLAPFKVVVTGVVSLSRFLEGGSLRLKFCCFLVNNGCELALNTTIVYKNDKNFINPLVMHRKSITLCDKNICDRVTIAAKILHWLNDQPRFQGGKHEISI